MVNPTPTLWQSISQLKRSANKLNSHEIECLNVLISTIAKQEEKTNQENILFAKLYCYLLSFFCKHYVDIDFSTKKINDILSQPLALRFEFLLLELKTMDTQNYFLSKGFLDPFLKIKTANELKKTHDNYEGSFPELNAKEFKEAIDNWDIDFVKANFETSINQSIINYKNLP